MHLIFKIYSLCLAELISHKYIQIYHLNIYNDLNHNIQHQSFLFHLLLSKTMFCFQFQSCLYYLLINIILKSNLHHQLGRIYISCIYLLLLHHDLNIFKFNNVFQPFRHSHHILDIIIHRLIHNSHQHSILFGLQINLNS